MKQPWISHTCYLAGAPQLAAVGIALSIYATATKLLNVSLLAVTTSNVATVMGDSRGDACDLGVKGAGFSSARLQA